ncbi:tail-related protein [Flavobacterium phage FPSV-S1]|nr:tail-related protein [Flavobacterium phage FPSV-S1]QCW20488.1 hypothetical protein [Flavobacterium phage FPSV-S8]QCW20651.1 hypothetical protein [Flavobacterium phage FPSV-S27]
MKQYNFLIKNLGLGLIKPKPFTKTQADQEITDRYSYLGTPVFSNLQIPAGEYKDNDGNTVQFDGIRVDTAIFEVTLSKNIVSTAINGRDGTVKQFISNGDYEIKCSGIIVGQSDASNAGFDVKYTNSVPEIEIRKFNAIAKIPQEIEVVSEYLDFFDISTVVITEASFAQREGFRDSILFNFSMLSDRPIELKQATKPK